MYANIQLYYNKLLIFGSWCFNMVHRFYSRCVNLFQNKVFHCCFMLFQCVSLLCFVVYQGVPRCFIAVFHPVSMTTKQVQREHRSMLLNLPVQRPVGGNLFGFIGLQCLIAFIFLLHRTTCSGTNINNQRINKWFCIQN